MRSEPYHAWREDEASSCPDEEVERCGIDAVDQGRPQLLRGFGIHIRTHVESHVRQAAYPFHCSYSLSISALIWRTLDEEASGAQAVVLHPVARALSEPPGVSRRLHFLRGWGHGTLNQVFTGDSRPWS